ncbi:MAG: tetratricopeptide (TPR) repeat protein [Hyphomicrobiaceae bacterium]|jgi:tetratricopeptide (TPR) repeat protein
MGWETALDRLLMQQIHKAEKDKTKTEQVQRQLLDYGEVAAGRPGLSFLLGYASALLNIELPVVCTEERSRRWRLFGSVRAFDRTGDRERIAATLEDPQMLLDLLSDPMVAGNALPLVVRSLFWSGDIKLAVRAIQYLAAEPGSSELETIVDAAVTDLLTRLETRVDSDDQESTASILGKLLGMSGFERLPNDVQARYHRALAERLLEASEWGQAIESAEKAYELADGHAMLESSASLVAALGEIREHDTVSVEPRAERTERDAALKRLQHVADQPDDASPEALYLRSLLAYETGDLQIAARGFERAIHGLRRLEGRDVLLRDRARFFQSAALLAAGDATETTRALKLMEQALETVKPDLESFYSVHEALKTHDRKLSLRFLDAVDVGRGSTPDQLLFVALEYLTLGEAAPASLAARRVLEVALDLDQRIEALRVVLTAHNMLGERDQARACYAEMRELLVQRGKFEQLEKLLMNEEFVGQALDHLEIKLELVNVYDELEGRDYERASLQVAIARSLKARKDVEALQQAYGLLQEVNCVYPELAPDELIGIERLLELNDEKPHTADGARAAVQALAKSLGRTPSVLVVGGNERQRRHHPRLDKLGKEWGFEGEWLMTNYTSPQKTVSTITDRLKGGVDLLILLHWNRHETTEPALEIARSCSVPARTVHYAGFTSLQVALAEQWQRMATVTS